MHLYEHDQYRYKSLSFAFVAYYRQYISPTLLGSRVSGVDTADLGLALVYSSARFAG